MQVILRSFTNGVVEIVNVLKTLVGGESSFVLVLPFSSFMEC